MIGTGVSASKDKDDLIKIIGAGLDGNVFGFDTAPSYKSEKLLSQVLNECCAKRNIPREKLFIQTKIDAWQMQQGNIKQFLDKALSDMQLNYLDSLLIHWPVPEYFEETWSRLVDFKKSGVVKNIGVCNVRKRHIVKLLASNDRPDIIQIERNPLRTCDDEISLCKENNIIIQSYSPLCKMDKRIADDPSINQIAKAHGKSIGQVVLRWHIDTGAVPIYTSRKPERIAEYADIFDFELSSAEISQISKLNQNFKLYLESIACPGI